MINGIPKKKKLSNIFYPLQYLFYGYYLNGGHVLCTTEKGKLRYVFKLDN